MLGPSLFIWRLFSRVEVMENEHLARWWKRVRLLALLGQPFIWAISLFIFMNVTSPLQSGPLSVLGAFVLIYLFVLSSLYAAAMVGYKIAGLIGWRKPLGRRRLYYLVSVVALGPVFILALNTLGQLEIKEVILVTLLLAMGCFYVLRRSRKEAL